MERSRIRPWRSRVSRVGAVDAVSLETSITLPRQWLNYMWSILKSTRSILFHLTNRVIPSRWTMQTNSLSTKSVIITLHSTQMVAPLNLGANCSNQRHSWEAQYCRNTRWNSSSTSNAKCLPWSPIRILPRRNSPPLLSQCNHHPRWSKSSS